jgi:plasmid stabilization system protein ParE
VKLQVVFTPQARDQVQRLKAWWRRNREKSPSLLRDELRRVLVLLSEAPDLGRLVKGANTDEVLRCQPVRKTPYLVYYVADRAAGQLRIVAVWSSMRVQDPPL